MFDFTLREEDRLVQETARRFAETELQPAIRAHERARDVSAPVRQRFRDTGLHAIEGAESADPASFVKVLVLEELSAVDPGAALALDGLGPALYPLLEAGEASRVERLREDPNVRGVVIEDLDERFRIENGRVFGEHPWVAADSVGVVVILQGDRALVVEEAVDLEPVGACGLETAGASRVRISGAMPALAIDDPRVVRRARSRIRTSLAAMLVGAARGAQRYSMRYATERETFGRPIAHHQAIAFLIADMAMAIEASRMAVWRAAAALDGGRVAEWEAACALAEAAEQGLFVGPNGVQLLGGHGFMKDHLVEKWMRDIRTLAQIAGGRDEAELVLAARVADHGMGL